MTSSLRLGHVSTSVARLGCRVDHLLEVVEQQQQLALGDVVPQASLAPIVWAMVSEHEAGIAQRCEPNPVDAGLSELGDELRGCLDRKPCLARATPAARVTRRAAVSEQRDDLFDSPALPCPRTSWLPGRFVFEIVLSGGKRSPLPSWKIHTGSAKVLQPMLPEICHLDAGTASRVPRGRAAPGCRGRPRCDAGALVKRLRRRSPRR